MEPAAIEMIEFKFKHSEMTYNEAREALEELGISPREALSIIGKWSEDRMSSDYD